MEAVAEAISEHCMREMFPELMKAVADTVMGSHWAIFAQPPVEYRMLEGWTFMDDTQQQHFQRFDEACRKGSQGKYKEFALICRQLENMQDLHPFIKYHINIVAFNFAHSKNGPGLTFAKNALKSARQLKPEGSLTKQKIWQYISDARKGIVESEDEVTVGCLKGEARFVGLEIEQDDQ